MSAMKVRKSMTGVHNEMVNAWDSATPMVPSVGQFKSIKVDIVNGHSTYKGDRRDMDTDVGHSTRQK